MISEEVFSTWSLRICLTGLIIFIFFIIWQLGQESKVGKLGMFILFLVLGLGVFGFIIKNILVEFLL